jgi:hypothetical protein
MAFYLFLRFQVGREPWPDFSDVGWQKIKLLRSRTNPKKKLSYSAQNLAIKTAFLDHNIKLKSWTHLGRKAGCQLGEALDVPDAQIRRLGHWDTSRMSTHYSSGIARQAARMLAGHGSEVGNYYLSRESMDPPEDLRRQIFPRIEESLEYVCHQSEEQQDLAAQAYLKVLDWFRTVLLQDAVELRRFYPSSPLWSHAPFNTPQFRAFEFQLESMKKANDLPMELQFKQLMPEVANQIQGVKEMMFNEFGVLTSNQKQVGEIVDRVGTQISAVVSRLTSIEAFTGRFARGEFKWITHLINPEGEGEGECGNYGADSTSQPTDSPVRPMPSGPIAIPPTSSNADVVALVPSRADGAQQIPQYEVNNNLNTVSEMWEEWDHGLIDNDSGTRLPSIRSLEEECGTSWRNSPQRSKRFSRRRLFIQRLQAISKNLNLPEASVAEKMEGWRQQKKMSLDKLQKTLRENPNQWGEGDMELLRW